MTGVLRYCSEKLEHPDTICKHYTSSNSSSTTYPAQEVSGSNSLYNSRVAVQTGHLSPELIKLRGQHYKPSMDDDILGGALSIIRAKIMDSSAPAMQTIAQPDIFCVGYEKVQVYPIHKVVAYMCDTDEVDLDEVEGIEKDTGMDNIGAVPDDPDLYHEDDIEEVEGTSAGYLQQQRDLLFS